MKNTVYEDFQSLGKLWRVGRMQNGVSHYTTDTPSEKAKATGMLDRGELALIVGPCVKISGMVPMIQCLTIHGIVWATLDGFRTDV